MDMNNYPADMVGECGERLALSDIRELQEQFNINTVDSDESWLNGDSPDNGLVTIIEETEFWERYGD